MRLNTNKQVYALLLVANYDSGVGYAWWLMESFWVKLAEHYHNRNRLILAFPSISKLPSAISQAPLVVVEQDFNGTSFMQLIAQCRFLCRNNVRIIYFSDKATFHWRYLLYRLCGVRCIVTHDHTPGLRAPARGAKKLLKRLAYHLPWFSVDGAIGATDFVRRRLNEVNCVPKERCYAAPNGLPPLVPTGMSADLHAQFRIPYGRKILVMTGRANRYKGVDFVLRCMALMPAQVRDGLQFLFIGDGPDLEYFTSAASKMGIVDNCTFAGRRDDVPALLEGAYIGIHPSQGEVGYSLSILEYMRAGLPVVVPDNASVCGATEHGYNGMIYPAGDVKAAAETIMVLLNDDGLRNRLGEHARFTVRQYTLDATHASLLDAFDEIIEKRLTK